MKLLTTILFLTAARADQPVHCLKSQVEGKWTIYVQTESFEPDIFNINEICTHNIEQKLQVIQKDHEWDLRDTRNIEVDLKPDFTGSLTNGDNANWSMIYDQGMFIEVPSQDMRFIANFRHYVHSGVDLDKYTTLRSDAYTKFSSDCTETMVGFV